MFSVNLLMHYLLRTGYLYITGRIKEILITRGGENIAPVPIEEKMMDQMKLLSYCMVIGDNQKYLTMFVTLRCEVGVALWSIRSCDMHVTWWLPGDDQP